MKKRHDAFLFFVLVALILVFAVVTVQQIRIAQFNERLFSIEDSVTRIEKNTGKLVGVVERYERALDIPEQEELGENLPVGDRRITK